jgi:sec-independent protein translocase protein TatC
VSLRKFRKFAILGSFLVSAVLTPPDVISQCFMAGPLCILYEIGIWVAYVFGRKPKKAEAEEEEQAKA